MNTKENKTEIKYVPSVFIDSKEFKGKEVKTIENCLNINNGNMELYLEIEKKHKDGTKEIVYSKKGDSLLANFLRILYLQMSGDGSAFTQPFYAFDRNIRITQVSSGAGGVIRLTFPTTIPAIISKVAIGSTYGFNFDGIYDAVKIDQYTIELTGTTYQTGWEVNSGFAWFYQSVNSFAQPSGNSFRSFELVVGKGNTAVTIDDFSLQKPVYYVAGSSSNYLTYETGTTIAEDTQDASSSWITISRRIKCNQGMETINEIGYYMRGGQTNYALLVMRDVIPGGVTIGEPEELTINYKIKVSLVPTGDAGGFLPAFMKLLYRNMASKQRVILDIDDVSRNYSYDGACMRLIGAGGKGVDYSTNGYEYQKEYKKGIVVGTGNTAVTVNDYYLEAGIQHGAGAGQLLHYGGFVQDFTVGSNYAEFKIYKAFENATVNPIVAKEYGLVGGSYNSTTGGNYLEIVHLYLLARNVLASPISISAGSVLKTIYTLRVSI